MQFTLSHALTPEEVRNRLKQRAPEIADMIPGGLAQVTTSWPADNQMDMTITAMGKDISGYVAIAAHEVVFVVNLPASLSLFAPMIAAKLEEKGRKLLR